MKFIIGFLFLTLATYCQDDTFDKVVTFNKGFRFSASGEIQTLPFLGGGIIDWNAILNKPSEFVPMPHFHSWSDITEKPVEVELQTAISQLSGLKLPVLTTSQINALVPEKGTLVYDSDMNVLKIYTGIWKTIITGN